MLSSLLVVLLFHLIVSVCTWWCLFAFSVLPVSLWLLIRSPYTVWPAPHHRYTARRSGLLRPPSTISTHRTSREG
ncbi:hypothetical protein K523DRAFT_322585 [Schizophyllum commune Tattone D]|nr:hypothetical protein K523DRAFT_322585 [Schizophyllum commune Tattone D]